MTKFPNLQYVYVTRSHCKVLLDTFCIQEGDVFLWKETKMRKDIPSKVPECEQRTASI